MTRLISKVLCHYRYDATDRLVGRSEPEALERMLFYCGSRQVTEIQGLSSRTTVMHGDLPLAQQSDEYGKRDTTLFNSDLQRSVLHVLQAEKPPSPITYTLYGHRTIERGLAPLPGFTGELADPITRHYPLGQGYRWFNPILMRFNNPDILSPFGKGGLNSYAYCLGDPVNRTDPTGHMSVLKELARSVDNISSTPSPSLIRDHNGFKIISETRNIAPDISTFTDYYQNVKRLNVSGHGGVFTIGGLPTSVMASSHESVITAKELVTALNVSGINIGDYKNIRLLSCHLADGYVVFGAHLARLTGKKVKTFSGKLTAFIKKDEWGKIDQSKKNFIIDKSKNYRPKFFVPWQAGVSGAPPVTTQPTSTQLIRQT